MDLEGIVLQKSPCIMPWETFRFPKQPTDLSNEA